MNLADITGEHIAKADFNKDKAFESFVRELFLHEIDQRHVTTTELEGPMKSGPADGQRDLIVHVADPPVTARAEGFRYALTWDEPGQHWYSCKGGPNWKETIKRELGNAAYCRSKEGTSPTANVKNRPSELLLRHLSVGGRYVFVISEQYIGRTELLAEFAELLTWWLEQSDLAVPDRLQLELIDANRLADFIRQHTPTLSAPFMSALGAHEPEAVMALDAWRRAITPGREPPPYEADPPRERLTEAITTLARDGSGARILRVHGPPGVGKTRAVYEALANPDEPHAGVRYTNAPALLLDSMRRWLPQSKRLTLVVDEVRSLDATELVHRFMSDSDADSRMILVGTSDEQSSSDFGGKVTSFPLETLSEAATRALIEGEFERASEVPDRRTQLILDLSEGYPLFAVKLAEALATDGDALEHGTDESNQWWAAQRVLVGPKAGVDAWEDKAELRGRCLFVVLLTADWPMAWDQLWEHHGEQLAKAMDRDADELRRARTDCVARELLREVDERHRYVSPANLVRIILNHYLGGPPDLGPRIIRHVPELRAYLMDLGRRVHVQPAVLRRLAQAEFRELERLVGERELPAIERLLRSSSGPGRACELDPAGAARILAGVTLTLGDRLHPTTRRVLAQNLTHTTRRRIDEASFVTAERAMLQLALLGDTDDYAPESWAALYLVALSPTHQPWPFRFGLLLGHARSAALDERLLVAATLPSLLQKPRTGPAYLEPDTRDGDWPDMPVADYLEARQQLWDLALEMTTDADTTVADFARFAVAERLGEAGIRRQSIEALAPMVVNWSPAQRQRLLEAVREINHLHEQEFGEHPDFAAALGALATALEPTDLTSKIIAQVSFERPIPLWSDDDVNAWMQRTDASDLELAERLLHAPADVREPILDWLTSPEAVRAVTFMRQLGRADHERALLSRLEHDARADGDTRLLPAYIAAWGDLDGDTADDWLGAHLDELPAVVVAAISARAPTLRRFGLIERLVDAGQVDTTQMRSFADRRWLRVVDTSRALALLERDIGPTAGLDMTLELLGRLSRDQRQRALELLDGFLAASSSRRVPMISQLGWRRALVTLAEAGRVERVADHLLSLLTYRFGSLSLAERCLRELLEAGHGPALWLQLRERLLEDRHRGVEQHLARVGMLRALDLEQLLAWVGKDRMRGELVARMTNPYTEQLDPVAARLLDRFGEAGPISRGLRSRALNNPQASWSLEFERRQYANATSWAQAAESARVRTWARALADELEEMIEAYNLREQARQRYA